MPLQLSLHSHVSLALHSSAAVSFFPIFYKMAERDRSRTPLPHTAFWRWTWRSTENSAGSITWWWQCFKVTRSWISTKARENRPLAAGSPSSPFKRKRSRSM